MDRCHPVRPRENLWRANTTRGVIIGFDLKATSMLRPMVRSKYWSMRRTPRVASPGVDGQERPRTPRHSDWAAAATAELAALMRPTGRLLFYSTSFTNRVSQGVAARLGLRRLGYLCQFQSLINGTG